MVGRIGLSGDHKHLADAQVFNVGVGHHGVAPPLAHLEPEPAARGHFHGAPELSRRGGGISADPRARTAVGHKSGLQANRSIDQRAIGPDQSDRTAVHSPSLNDLIIER